MSGENRAKTVLIGVGNSALRDEGVGGRIIRELGGRTPPGVEVVDAGLPGFGLIALLEGREKAVIIDAIDADGPPGTVYRFRADRVASARARPSCSLHQGDVLQYVKLAEALGMGPKEVVLIGVQPGNFSPGEDLSPAVEAAIPEAAALALAEASS